MFYEVLTPGGDKYRGRLVKDDNAEIEIEQADGSRLLFPRRGVQWHPIANSQETARDYYERMGATFMEEQKAYLGYATTLEMIKELEARFTNHAVLGGEQRAAQTMRDLLLNLDSKTLLYRTVDS